MPTQYDHQDIYLKSAPAKQPSAHVEFDFSAQFTQLVSESVNGTTHTWTHEAAYQVGGKVVARAWWLVVAVGRLGPLDDKLDPDPPDGKNPSRLPGSTAATPAHGSNKAIVLTVDFRSDATPPYQWARVLETEPSTAPYVHRIDTWTLRGGSVPLTGTMMVKVDPD